MYVRSDKEKVRFYDEMASEWDLGSSCEVIVSLGILMNMWGNVLRVLKVYIGEWYWEKNAVGRRLLEFCDEKELCVAVTWFYKADKKKITYTAGGCETVINFVLVGKKYREYVMDVKMDTMGTSAQAGGRKLE